MGLGVSEKCETFRILECVNSTEYQALSDAAKAGLQLWISCGEIDTHEGTKGRDALFQIFPSGVTHDALVVLFTFVPPGQP